MRHKFYANMIAILSFFVLTIMFFTTSHAQEVVQTPLDLDPIRIPIFAAPFNILPNSEHATILSWVGFFGSIITIGIVVFWIYLILKASFQALKSQENPDEIGEAQKRVVSTFIGAGLSILIPVIISIVGVFVGAGPLWNWPVAFRKCEDGTDRYYYQVVIENAQTTDSKTAVEQAEARCF
jgi:hypothetical protein